MQWLSHDDHRHQTIRNAWKCFEAPGVEPVFLDQEQAIDYAKKPRARSGEIRVLDCDGDLALPLRYPRFISVQLSTYIVSCLR